MHDFPTLLNWGLRNYAGGSDLVWGGKENCEHEWVGRGLISDRKGVETVQGKSRTTARHYGDDPTRTWSEEHPKHWQDTFCSLCSSWRGQLGLEPTPELYVEHLMLIFREVKRVLRKDGSFYLNIGDTYGGSGSPGGDFKDGKGDNYLRPYAQAKLTPKCMTCIPERVMFAMLDDGWILRNKVIWHKPNAMPGSQKDRFSCTWEYIFFFTKARKYYFDLDAVRIPHTTESLERYQRGVNLDRAAVGKSAEVGPMQQYKRAPGWFQEMFPPDQDYKGKFDDLFGHGPQPQSFNLRVRDVKRGKGGVSAQGGELKASDKEIEEYDYPEKMPRHHGSGPQYKLSGLARGSKHHGSSMSNQDSLHLERQKHESADLGAQSPARKKHTGYFSEDGQPLVDFAKGKNPGDYWDVTTQPSSICVCPECDAIFPRYTKVCPRCYVEGVVGHFAPYPVALCEMPIKASTRVGDIVLDPLAGGGNTGVAAKLLGRRCILIDVVRSYCIMARRKLSRVDYQPPLFASSPGRED